MPGSFPEPWLVAGTVLTEDGVREIRKARRQGARYRSERNELRDENKALRQIIEALNARLNELEENNGES